MKWLTVFLVLSMLIVTGHAKDGVNESFNMSFEIAGLDLSGTITALTDSLYAAGLVPDLSNSCTKTDTTCEEGCGSDAICVNEQYCRYTDCNPLSAPETKAFFMILIMIFMTLSVVVGMSGMPSAIISFFLTSFLFNHVNVLFSPVNAQGLFEYVFSALFVFIWTDYLLEYMWAISPTTRLFMVSSVTLIALFFMGIEAVYSRIEWMLGFFLGQVGFTMFFLFMIAMNFFNTFVSLTSVKGATKLREKGGAKVDKSKTDIGREFKSRGG